MSSVTSSGLRTHKTIFSKAPASPVKKPAFSEGYDAAFDFTGVLFGNIREPDVPDHNFTSFGAAFTEEFPTDSPSKKKRVRHLEVSFEHRSFLGVDMLTA